MGHTRLGSIPKSKKWNQVVEIFLTDKPIKHLSENEIIKISLSTIEAAKKGLDEIKSDEGLVYTFYLLSKLVLNAANVNWIAELRKDGILINEKATAADLQIELHAAIDDYCDVNSINSDIKEMAQKAAGITISDLLVKNYETFFSSSALDIQLSLRKFSNSSGFAEIGQKFFGNFLNQFLNFYLSRITSAKLGMGIIDKVNDITEFNKSFEIHCHQSAKIVKQFTGEWISKTNFLEGVTSSNIKKFVAVAIQKIQAELGKQEKGQ